MKKIKKLATYFRLKLAQNKLPELEHEHEAPANFPKVEDHSVKPEQKWQSYGAILNLVKTANALGGMLSTLEKDLGYDIYSSIEEKEKIQTWLTSASNTIKKIQFGAHHLKRFVEESGLSVMQGTSYKSQLQAFTNELKQIPMVKGSASATAVSNFENALNAWRPEYIPENAQTKEEPEEPTLQMKEPDDSRFRQVIEDKVEENFKQPIIKTPEESSLQDPPLY